MIQPIFLPISIKTDVLWQRLRSETDHELRAALICLLTAALAHEGTAAIIGEAEGGWFWLPPWSREAFHGIRNSQRSIFFLNGNYRLLDKMCRALTPNCEASRYETRQRCGTEQIHVLPKDVAVFTNLFIGKGGMRINDCKRMVSGIPCTRIIVGLKVAIRKQKWSEILSVAASAFAFREGTA
jgi:hypothetical protein